MPGANRYTNVNWSAPISSYVKPPLEMLQAVGQTMQGRHDKALDDTYKLNDLMASVNAIDQHKGFKKELDSKYQPKIDDITGKILAGDNLSAQRDLNKIKRDWQNDPMRLQLEQSYTDYGKEIKDQAELKSKGLYTEVYDPFNGFKGTMEDGSIEGYRYKGSRPTQDYLTIGQGLMKDVTKHGSTDGSYSFDQSGNVIGHTKGWEGVLRRDINRVAEANITPFLKSKEGLFYIDEARHRNPNITNDELLTGAHGYLANLGEKQIGGIGKDVSDFKYAPAYIAKAGKDEEILNDILRPNTVEGVTMDATQAVPGMKESIDNGVFTNKNGIITFNLDGLMKESQVLSGHTTISMGPGMTTVNTTGKNITSIEKSKQFNSLIGMMSKAMGVDPKTLSTDGKFNEQEITKLATSYNQLVKSRILDVNMSPFIKANEGKQATQEWNEMTQLDLANPEHLKPKAPLEDGDKIVSNYRRIDKNGKMYMEGYIQRKGGAREPIAYRTNNVEKNLVYDGLGKVQKASVDFLTDDNIKPADANLTKSVIETNFGKKRMMILHSPQPVGDQKYITTLGDPNDRRNVIYAIQDGKTGKVIYRNSLGEAKKDIEIHYHKNTPEGRTELQSILGNKDLYKENQEAPESE